MATSLRFRIVEDAAAAASSALGGAAQSVTAWSERDVSAQSPWLWSGYFLVDKVGEFTMRVRHKTSGHRYVRVEVFPAAATTFVTFSAADEKHPPYRVENRSFTDAIRFRHGRAISAPIILIANVFIIMHFHHTRNIFRLNFQ